MVFTLKKIPTTTDVEHVLGILRETSLRDGTEMQNDVLRVDTLRFIERFIALEDVKTLTDDPFTSYEAYRLYSRTKKHIFLQRAAWTLESYARLAGVFGKEARKKEEWVIREMEKSYPGKYGHLLA